MNLLDFQFRPGVTVPPALEVVMSSIAFPPEIAIGDMRQSGLLSSLLDRETLILPMYREMASTSTTSFVRSTQEFGEVAVRSLKVAWTNVSSSPPIDRVHPIAIQGQQKVSLVPLGRLLLGASSRTGLTVGTQLLAHRMAKNAVDKNTPPPLLPNAQGDVDQFDGILIVYSIVMGTCFLGSCVSAIQFAQDTATVCPQRAKASLFLSLGGLLSATLGTALAGYYLASGALTPYWASFVPRMLGFYMLVVRLPHSFTCSEIKHGNTPGKFRAETSTHLWPIAVAIITLMHHATSDARVPPFLPDIIFGTALSLIVVSFALVRTDMSRLASSVHSSTTSLTPR